MRKLHGDDLNSKNYYTYIKGIAIILMVIHHAYGFPQWHLKGSEWSNLLNYHILIQNASIICVSIFVFITGGAYYINNNKTIKYSIKKLVCFLGNYWYVQAILYIVAICLADYKPSIKSTVLEMFGINTNIMFFCWYVSFYILLMMILPLYAYVVKGNNIIKNIVVSIILYGGFRLVSLFILKGEILAVFNGVLIYIPVAMSGYFIVKFDILNKIYNKFNINISSILFGVGAILFVFIFGAKHPFVKNISAGVVLVPVLFLAISLTGIFNSLKIRRLLEVLGKNSMNIWFIHGIFWGKELRSIFQPFAYCWKEPILVVCWILICCTVLSMLIEKSKNVLFKNLISKRKMKL